MCIFEYYFKCIEMKIFKYIKQIYLRKLFLKIYFIHLNHPNSIPQNAINDAIIDFEKIENYNFKIYLKPLKRQHKGK